ncbi:MULTISPECIES: ketoacyl-ACP synthase III [unclassified Actinomadura]|uniref:3-oxoacyl-ACP synthase III family protein n=1 Tax=unclassified Actinomadura TaxID=2626254 RepID=UPI001F1BFC94|nr:ketoacyl-ACP synthase III [Actinomadura sp. K4S16]
MAINPPAGPRDIGIIGTGSYLPGEAVSNSDVGALCGASEEWILRKTGITGRHYAAAHEASSDLAVRAGAAALADARTGPGGIGLIVVATSTPDHPQPATACLVQDRLGARAAAAFDLNSVCSGFVYALVAAAALLAADPRAGRALVIGVDVYSRIIDPADRRTAVLFGDGAGAAVIGQVPPGRGLLGWRLDSHGEHHAMIGVEAGGSRTPASSETVAGDRHRFRMDGRAVRRFIADELPAAIRALVADLEIAPEEIDHLIPHQANDVLLGEVFPSLGLRRARMHRPVAAHGNTGAASIPVALDLANRAGELGHGDLVMLAGFGGGMSLGTALLRWNAPRP